MASPEREVENKAKVPRGASLKPEFPRADPARRAVKQEPGGAEAEGLGVGVEVGEGQGVGLGLVEGVAPVERLGVGVGVALTLHTTRRTTHKAVSVNTTPPLQVSRARP
jgi:hypothetical protein